MDTHLTIRDCIIKEFVIPEHITHIICNNIGLQKLYVHDNVRYVDCSYNSITSLRIPTNVEYIYAHHNKIEYVYGGRCPNTKIIDISFNRLDSFDIKLPPTISEFIVNNNPLQSIRYWDFIFGPQNDPECTCDTDCFETIDPEHERTDSRIERLWKYHDEYTDWKKI